MLATPWLRSGAGQGPSRLGSPWGERRDCVLPGTLGSLDLEQSLTEEETIDEEQRGRITEVEQVILRHRPQQTRQNHPRAEEYQRIS